MESLQFTPDEVDRFIAEGTAGAADIIAKEALARSPRDPQVWAALSRVAAAIGDPDAAARFARVAQELTFPPRAALAGPSQRYLVVKAWGYGFCSDLDHVLGALLLCELSGRTPVTHWGSNSLFSIDPARDAFRTFFEPLSPCTIDDLVGKGFDFWPPKWNESNLRAEVLQKQSGEHSRLSALQLLNRPERVVVSDYYSSIGILAHWIGPGHPMHGRRVEDIGRYLYAKYLRPLEGIRREVDEFAAKHFLARPIVAVHVRGGDKPLEDADYPQKLAVYPDAIDFVCRGDKSCRIFLLTDSTSVVDEYRRRYGPRLVTTDCARTSTGQGLHYLPHGDRHRLGVEVLRDVLLAARCDRFVGIGSSSVSCMVHNAKAWDAADLAMIGPMMSTRVEASNHMSFEQLERYVPPGHVAALRRTLV